MKENKFNNKHDNEGKEKKSLYTYFFPFMNLHTTQLRKFHKFLNYNTNASLRKWIKKYLKKQKKNKSYYRTLENLLMAIIYNGVHSIKKIMKLKDF